MTYYLFDQNRRIVFKGESLSLALQICRAGERMGVETTLAVEKPQEEHKEHGRK